MKRTLSAVEARKRLGELLEGVYYRGDEVVIERAGKPMAVVVPASVYETMLRRQEDSKRRLFELIEKNWDRNRDVPFEEIEREVDDVVREVRAEIQREREAGDLS